MIVNEKEGSRFATSFFIQRRVRLLLRKVKGDSLARALRKKFKSQEQFPKRKFLCVYSDELLTNRGHNATCGTEQCMCPKAKIGPGDPTLLNHEWCSSKAQINGTMAHVTAIFGFTLAGLVLQDVMNSA